MTLDVKDALHETKLALKIIIDAEDDTNVLQGALTDMSLNADDDPLVNECRYFLMALARVEKAHESAALCESKTIESYFDEYTRFCQSVKVMLCCTHSVL